MKISSNPHIGDKFPSTYSSKAQNLLLDSDLQQIISTRKPAPRKARTLKLTGAQSGKRSRPETPLLKWKIEDGGLSVKEDNDVAKKEIEKEEGGRRRGRSGRRGKEVAISARKLAAGIWKLQLPETVVAGSRRRSGQIGFQFGVRPGVPFECPRSGKVYGFEAKDNLQSPSSTLRNGFLSKLQPSFRFSNSVMEGATKWDPVCLKTSEAVRQLYSQMKVLGQQVSAFSMVSALEAELEQAQACIQELETERRSSKKKVQHFLRKVSEEKVAWRSREREKIRAFIDEIKAELHGERKSCQRIEILNSKLVNELADAKFSAKRFMQDYERERKARELIVEVCDELAKEIGEDKAEIEALKRESTKFRKEVEDERKMLQMAEVWREERVQMKLVDAKVALEEKYSQMNKLVADLENFLRSAAPDSKEMREAELLQHAATAVNVQDIKEFSYEPPNPDDIFSVLEEVNFGEPTETEIEPCVLYSPASHGSRIHTVSPEVNGTSKNCFQRSGNGFADQYGDIEDESGWETVSHIEHQDSSYSPEGSAPSSRECYASHSGTDWEEIAGEETPVTEITEVCSLPGKHLKKVSSIARLWRSNPNNEENYKIISIEGIKGKISNGRVSNAGIVSPDSGLSKGRLSPSDIVGQWSSTDSGHSHIRGMKGCIPHSAQKNSLKSKLPEASFESQKVQLRHVLKQKI